MTRPPVSELLRTPDAYLWSRDLYALGLGRAAVDAVFDAIGTRPPGYTRKKVVLVADWLAYRERFAYARDRVRPAR